MKLYAISIVGAKTILDEDDETEIEIEHHLFFARCEDIKEARAYANECLYTMCPAHIYTGFSVNVKEVQE